MTRLTDMARRLHRLKAKRQRLNRQIGLLTAQITKKKTPGKAFPRWQKRGQGY